LSRWFLPRQSAHLYHGRSYLLALRCCGGSLFHREFGIQVMKESLNKVTAANAGWPDQFRIRGSRHWPGVAEPER
jgi:hypothetical protein